MTAGSRAQASRFVDLVADKLLATEAVFRHHLGSDVPFIEKAGRYLGEGAASGCAPPCCCWRRACSGMTARRRSPTRRWSS